MLVMDDRSRARVLVAALHSLEWGDVLRNIGGGNMDQPASICRAPIAGRTGAQLQSPRSRVSLASYRVGLPLIMQIIVILVPSFWGMRGGLGMTARSWVLQTLMWISICATAVVFISARFNESRLVLSAVGPIAYTLINRKSQGGEKCVF